MNAPKFYPRIAIAVLVAAAASLLTVSCAKKADQSSAGQALPITATFGEGTPGPNEGPYAVTLTNNSSEPITVTATVQWSVTSHNRTTQTVMPPREIPAGGSWVINDLAANDRIVVVAEGYEPLELTTPAGGK